MAQIIRMIFIMEMCPRPVIEVSGSEESICDARLKVELYQMASR
jgi:hypothetical protein